jgi:hypothetical protein
LQVFERKIWASEEFVCLGRKTTSFLEGKVDSHQERAILQL